MNYGKRQIDYYRNGLIFEAITWSASPSADFCCPAVLIHPARCDGSGAILVRLRCILETGLTASLRVLV
jgi:hypothetical protein